MRSILLILVIVFITSSSATSRALKCRRCLVHVKVGTTVGSGSAPPFFPQEKPPSSEKKPNVGAVVGLTFLLVFLLGLFFLCVYRMRRTATAMGSRRRGTTTRQDQAVGQSKPSVPMKDNPPVVQDEVKVVQHNNRPRGQDDNKRVEGLNNARDKQRNQGAEPFPFQGGRGKPADRPLDEVDKAQAQAQVVKGKGKNQVPDRPLDEVDKAQAQAGVVKGKGKNQVPDRPLDEVEKVRPRDNELKGGEGKDKVRGGGLPDPLAEADKVKGKGKEKQDEVAREMKVDEKVGGRRERRRRRNERGDVHGGEQGKGLPGDGRAKKRDRSPKEAHPVDEDNVERQPKREKEAEGQQRRDDVKAGKRPLQPPSLAHQNSLGLTYKYTFEELRSVTNDFDPENKIGGGAFGKVYKGTLPNGTMIAVKCLRYGGNNRIDDFKNEVESLGRADHPNLVKLIGYYSRGITRILVYEYMINGSLDKWIFWPKSPIARQLTWAEMKKIIKGIAKGLVYLHEKCDKTILHRDLKPDNVVLDEKLNAKLCDFGIAKLLNKDQTSTSTRWAGTPGYIAPESMKRNVRITDKVDVYSFGVVVLEVMFGEHHEDLVTVDKVRNREEVRLDDLIRNLSEDMRRNGTEIERIGRLAKWCIRDSPDERPSMKVVLAGLRAI